MESFFSGFSYLLTKILRKLNLALFNLSLELFKLGHYLLFKVGQSALNFLNIYLLSKHLQKFLTLSLLFNLISLDKLILVLFIG